MTNIIKTSEKTIGIGTFDNGQYPEKYNKTEHYEVSLDFFYGKTYVHYTRIVNNGIRKESINAPIEKVSNKEVLELANELLKNK